MAESVNSDLREKRYLDYPYSVSGSHIPSTTTGADHLRDLILQVLFTNPGERVNLPEFGVGIERLLFEPNGDALRTSAQFVISTNLNRWLGDRIEIEQVSVTSEVGAENIVTIDIVYKVKVNQERERLRIEV